MKQEKKFSVCLVNYEEGIVQNGILTKHAKMMEKELLDLGHDVVIKNVPDSSYDINHHINYIAAQDCDSINTTMVTHFTSDMYDMDEKLGKMRHFIDSGGTGICFSKGVELYLGDQGMDRKKLKTVLPAHDGRKRRPRIIMIAFKVYPDGRKREEMFEKLVATIDPSKFIFRIIGPGWKPLLDRISKKNIQVQWLETYQEEFYAELLNSSDYCLYTGGEDAIAQCIVDSKNAGLRIIAPAQEDVDVEYKFDTQRELNKIFEKLAENPVEKWNWENYTLQHVKIWADLYKSSLKKRKEGTK